jgi:hypothetical protein
MIENVYVCSKKKKKITAVDEVVVVVVGSLLDHANDNNNYSYNTNEATIEEQHFSDNNRQYDEYKRVTKILFTRRHR